MINPERYRKIDEVFRAALEVEPGKRSEFISSACSGDETLQKEVEALIDSAGEDWSLIDGPVPEMATLILPERLPDCAVGDSLGHYQILSLLGVGGMGQVYLAQDTRLGRKVALKLLPLEFTRNESRLRRFQQEAHAASALNHPNILTIHDIAEIDGRQLIATEFIDGETLRERLTRAPSTLSETLDIAIQIASALSAAHQAGIVHRDIKPENVMLRRDGYVKVLDFGLAKLTEQSEKVIQTNDVDNVNISSGLVMGTVKYMSPEQTVGLELDPRSDIFSFGVVLYEMIAGRAPFEGESAKELIASTLRKDPPPLSDLPAEMQRLVSRSLRKEKEERYQTVSELLADLKNVRERLKERPRIEDLIAGVLEHRIRAALVLGTFVIVALLASLGLYSTFKSRAGRFQNITVTKFTNFGDASNPSISPDGQYVVYAKGWGTEGPGKFSLWRRAVGTSTETLLVPPTEIDGWVGATSFSPDGNYVRYWARLRNQPRSMYEVPLFGGEPRKVPLKNAAPTGFSADGKRLAYLDNRLALGKTVLVVANADGTDEREIITRQAPNYYRTAIKPIWSPDGKVIACVGQNGNESFARVLAIDIGKGTETAITQQKWTAFRDFVWLPDMSGLLIAAAGETSSIFQIWHVSYPEGIVRRITNDTGSYFNLDLTADGKTLVAAKVDAPTQFWVLPLKGTQPISAGVSTLYDTSNARQINSPTIGSGENMGLAWTPDGRIVYVSEESGNADIWSMNADGSDQKQLTTDPHRDANLDVSPDGRYIAWVSEREGAENIWIMNVDGSNQRRLTGRFIERAPVFSADSKWVFFNSWETGKGTIWKVPVEGGEPTQVISELSFAPIVSPDGKWLSYVSQGKILIGPAEGGPPTKSLSNLVVSDIRWAPDGRALTFTCVSCKHYPDWPDIWVQPLDGEEPHQLTNFRLTYIFQYAWSRDGKQIAVATHTLPSDLVLISDLK